MKIIVQSPISFLYIDIFSQWTRRIQDARLFKTPSEAITLCLRQKLRSFQVILKFEEERYDATVINRLAKAMETGEALPAAIGFSDSPKPAFDSANW
ncbi:MAG: hypothetical protein JWQ71_1030 [Pedosphaera sp.]|nr:hypothetical protein [Pedosphaera sp.]